MILVGDLHFGIKENIEEFVSYQNREFERICENAKETGEDVFFLGDVFDNRRAVNIKTLKNIISNFTKLSKISRVFIIVGNHDTYFKDTNAINSPLIIFEDIENIKVIHDEPEEILSDGVNVLCVPWINKDNFEACTEAIKTTKSKICLGHFEINGFAMNSYTKCEHGFGRDIFKSFDNVFSGHFHTKSEEGNIRYLGSNTELTWNDFGDSKGFYSFDPKSGTTEFLESIERIFHKLVISENTDMRPMADIKNSFIKIFINKKLSPKENKMLSSIIENNLKYEVIDNTILESDVSISVKEEDFSEMLKEGISVRDIEYKKECFDLIMETRDELMRSAK